MGVDEVTRLSLVSSRLCLTDELVYRNEQRRIAHYSSSPVDSRGQLRQRFEVVARARLGGRSPDRLCESRIDAGLEFVVDHGVGVPYVEFTYLREHPHALPVRFRAPTYHPFAVRASKPAHAPHHTETGDQPLDIPLPRAG